MDSMKSLINKLWRALEKRKPKVVESLTKETDIAVYNGKGEVKSTFKDIKDAEDYCKKTGFTLK